jgi:hypothetical protein
MINPLPKASPRMLALAEDYFSFLARSMPVCCLSDEFHFMPRVELARFHKERTDCLARDFLEELCGKVKAWKAQVETFVEDEDPGLANLLGQSMDSLVMHWETLGLWKRDPGLYLKVAFIGLDQALSWPLEGGEEKSDLYRARLDGIARLLSWGMDQLDEVPQPAREAALDMVDTCRTFLSRVVEERAKEEGLPRGDLVQKEQGALESLDRFQGFLNGMRSPAGFSPGAELFQEILGRGFGWTGDVEEAGEILAQEAADKEGELADLAGEIDPHQDWRAIYGSTGLPEKAYGDTVSLYREEVERLESFIGRLNILSMPPKGSVRVEPTPPYLQPIRATASYSAPPFLDDRVREGCFFVQVVGAEKSLEEGRRRFETVHREYRYLTAHETYPGHHALDWARLCQRDPIRRRIESALFYEGWACYAEQLVDELGYHPDPRQRLIRLKRDLWRAVRGRLDVDLHIGAISLEQGAERLEALGYAPRDAWKQARRITLTPGYQLCYTLGKHHFLDLRRRHVPPLPLADFHAIVFGSGQVPFVYLARILHETSKHPDRDSSWPGGENGDLYRSSLRVEPGESRGLGLSTDHAGDRQGMLGAGEIPVRGRTRA